MITMYPVRTLSLLYLLTSCVLLALRYGRVNADGETVLITLKCCDIKNVTSPNYPEHYNNNLEIHWDVRADLAQRILVTFDDFHTENSDSLYVKEENYPSVGAKYSGSKGISPYLSLGNRLSILFISDLSQSKTGFHLSLSSLMQTDNTDIHEALEGSEHIRVLTQPVCKNAWHTDVADTICREAGFPGAYETTWSNAASGSNGTNYQCNTFTHRLQDCSNFTTDCIDAYKSVEISCNVLSRLGCFNLEQHIHLLSRSVNASRDQCLTYCNSYSTTPQYAVHHSGTNCTCINQTALDITKLTEDSGRCRTTVKDPTGHWATLFNVSFGFCNEPPPLHDGIWKTTSSGYMYGTSITAMCNDDHELVGGDKVLKCGRGANSSSQDFDWHGNNPSCREQIFGSIEDMSLTGSVFPSTDLLPDEPVNGTCKSINYCAIPLSALVPVVVLFTLALISVLVLIVVEFVLWLKRRSKSIALDSSAVQSQHNA